MDIFDNKVDSDLLEKVDEILTGKTTIEDEPELVFDAGFEADVNIPDAGFDFDAPAAPEFSPIETPLDPEEKLTAERIAAYNERKAQRGETQKPKNNDFSYDTKAKIGFGIGVIAILVSFMGMALGVLPIAIGIFYSAKGRKGSKPKLALAGLILNIIGAILWGIAVVRGGLLA